LPTSIGLSGGNGTYLYQPTSTQSVFGRVDYSYNDRYLLGVTVRRDGFSSFYPGRQYGTFPSASLGWRVSQEDFMKGISWINDLKLRGSYGATGSNANIGGTNAVNTYNYGFGSTAYGIGGGLNTTTTGYAQTSIGNPKTTWETDKVLNIGLDVSLFNHLDVNAEYYKKSISGLLFPLPLPATAGGASAPTVNVGDVQNQGVDVAVTYHDQIGSDFRFSVGATFTSYKNRITKLPTPGYFDVLGGSRIGSLVREQVGEPIGEFYGYQVEGIYQNAAQLAALPEAGATVGAYKYKDVNGDGKIDANDRTFIGNPNPNFTYGVNLNASYKGFDFTMVLYGSQGNKDFNYVKYWTDTYHSFPGGKDINLLTNSANVDPATNTVTNPGATQQALSVSTTPPSTFYVENGSFLKCRVASIGYTFGPGFLKAVGIDKLHVYTQVTNLFTITKYSGLDPELVPSISNVSGTQASSAFGIDFGAYPNNQKNYTVGVNMTF
jgi:TonB-linked SusC/RagA family outer membrane protein